MKTHSHQPGPATHQLEPLRKGRSLFLTGDELILVRRSQVFNSQIVSTLASCGRLPATVPDLANRPRQLVFLTPIDSQLNDFLNEVHQIARLEPSIVERIDEDLDLHAKKKKLQRLIDVQFLAGQTLICPNCSCNCASLNWMTSNWRKAGPAPKPISSIFS